jgi:hypothetical protein
MVKAGSKITVQAPDGSTLLQGTFQSEESEETSSELKAALTGTTGATGSAEVNIGQEEGTTKVQFELHFMGGAANTTYSVLIDGTKVAQVTTDASGRGVLELENPANFPMVKAGSMITVQAPDGSTLLQGTFQASQEEHDD